MNTPDNLDLFLGIASKTQSSIVEETEISTISSIMEEFFIDLNTDTEYDEERYGGIREKGFHPSALYKEICARRLVFGYNELPQDYPSTISGTTRRLFDNGHDCHDRWQRYFLMMAVKYPNDIELLGCYKCKGCGYKVGEISEINITDLLLKKDIPVSYKPCPSCGSIRWKYNEFKIKDFTLKITGKRDGRLKIKAINMDAILEIKSMGNFQFINLLKAGQPLVKHIFQANMYMYLSKMDTTLFLYENKDTQAVKLFIIKYDESIIEDVLDLTKIASQYIDNNSIPDRLVGFPYDKTCKICEWREICKK